MAKSNHHVVFKTFWHTINGDYFLIVQSLLSQGWFFGAIINGLVTLLQRIVLEKGFPTIDLPHYPMLCTRYM
jgi:hypothetical protein